LPHHRLQSAEKHVIIGHEKRGEKCEKGKKARPHRKDGLSKKVLWASLGKNEACLKACDGGQCSSRKRLKRGEL